MWPPLLTQCDPPFEKSWLRPWPVPVCSQTLSLNGDSKPELCDAGAELYQLSYQSKWEMVLTNCAATNLLRSRLSGCHATLPRKEPFGGALRDIPKDGCSTQPQTDCINGGQKKKCSIVFVLIRPTGLVSKDKIQRKCSFRTRLVGLIST